MVKHSPKILAGEQKPPPVAGLIIIVTIPCFVSLQCQDSLITE